MSAPKLRELMAKLPVPDPEYTGIVMNDDMILAIDTSADQTAEPDDYVVVQGAIEGVDPQLNATSNDTNYIREGQSSVKTSTQRVFTVTGHRQIGNLFQDHIMSTSFAYAVGQAVVRKYLWICALNGKGERGQVSIQASTDGGGNAGEPASISVEMRKTGDTPAEYVYGGLTTLTITSVAGAAAGTTRVTVSPAMPAGFSAKYKTDATVELPTYGDTVTDWTDFSTGTEIAATTDNEIAVVYLNAEGKAAYGGKTKVVAAA